MIPAADVAYLEGCGGGRYLPDVQAPPRIGEPWVGQQLCRLACPYGAWQQAARHLGKPYRKVAPQRANTLHQVTSRLAKTKSVVVMDNLNVAGMLKNQHLAQAIADVGCADFRRHREHKAQWYGCRVIVADRWFASSRTCSGCGWVDERLTLADRTFCCQAWGLVIDRDLNAAINLEKLAGSSSDSRNACGEWSNGLCRVAQVELSSVKQEPDTFSSLVG